MEKTRKLMNNNKTSLINGYEVLILDPGKYQFGFGKFKCKMIIENMYKIKAHINMFGNHESKHAPELRIEPDSKYPIILTLHKCEVIVNCEKEIREFIK